MRDILKKICNDLLIALSNLRANYNKNLKFNIFARDAYEK